MGEIIFPFTGPYFPVHGAFIHVAGTKQGELLFGLGTIEKIKNQPQKFTGLSHPGWRTNRQHFMERLNRNFYSQQLCFNHHGRKR